MDFGNLLKRAWNIVWEHKFLIVLGIIVAIISGGGSGMSGGGSSSGGDTEWGEHTEYGDPDQQDFQDFDFGEDGRNFEDFNLPAFSALASLMAIAGGFLAVIIVVALIIGLVLSYISRVATGAIIAGANQIEATGASSFGEAWRAGWARGLNLFLIGLVGSLPMIVTVIVIAILVIPLIGVNTQLEDMETLVAANVGLTVAIFGLCCVGALISLVVSAIRTFADRACVLQEKGVVESYAEGWNVLRHNLGSAVLLFLIQLGIQLAIGLMLAAPAIIASVCCFLQPVMWVLSGTSLAYFATLWTLAWREWTGKSGSEPVVIEQAPAV